MTDVGRKSVDGSITLRKIVALCTAGGFLDGYSLLIMSAALLLLIPRFKMAQSTVGLVTAIPFIGMAIGALIAGQLSDKFGRRLVFLIDVTAFLIVDILLGFSQNVGELVVLRFILGLAIGADMPTSSSMLAEFSPPKLRGALTSLLNTVWLFGFIVAGIVGYILYQTGSLEAWRWMFFSAAVPALIVVILRRDVPETPRWLRASGRVEEAKIVEQKIISSGLDTSHVEVSAQRGQFSEVFKNGNWKPVLFFASYWFIQSIAGAPLLSYTAVIFHRVIKFSGANALLFSVGLSCLYVIFSLITQFTVLERSGRKSLAVWTCAITAVGAVVTAFVSHVTVLLVIAYAVAIVASQLTVIPYWPWSVEMLPTQIRATGQSIGSAGGKVGAFLGTLLLPSFLAATGWTVSFLTVTVIFIVVLLIVAIFGKETKNRSLDTAEGISDPSVPMSTH
ncbi:sugar porter family MFS transporter [Alicyclobacillus tolerans]|uniref:MFS transporter n=1 Tax=Alicyclobacillus tolerans TaxID=90970 RepID=UPI001F17384C|nr:MFS transporter [Alicyclobacillus tolerans]MCF8563823.1 sugar porter family MFS transporter [Alicyclobacillus tolerans]